MVSLLDRFKPPPPPAPAPPKPKKKPRPNFAKFAASIAELTNNGQILIDFAIKVVNGEIDGATVRDMLEAKKFLRDGMGFQRQKLEVSGEVKHTARIDLSKLTDAELDAYIALQAKAKVAALPPASSIDVIDVNPDGED